MSLSNAVYRSQEASTTGASVDVAVPSPAHVVLAFVWYSGGNSLVSTTTTGRVGFGGSVDTAPVFGTWERIGVTTNDTTSRGELWLGFGFPSAQGATTNLRVYNSTDTTGQPTRTLWVNVFALGPDPHSVRPALALGTAVASGALSIAVPGQAVTKNDLVVAADFALINANPSSSAPTPTTDVGFAHNFLSGRSCWLRLWAPANRSDTYSETWGSSSAVDHVALIARLTPPAPANRASGLYKGRDTKAADEGAAA